MCFVGKKKDEQEPVNVSKCCLLLALQLCIVHVAAYARVGCMIYFFLSGLGNEISKIINNKVNHNKLTVF